MATATKKKPKAEPAAKSRPRKATQSRTVGILTAEISDVPLSKKKLAAGAALRRACRKNLQLFNEKVFPLSSGLKPFGQVQIDSIAHDQAVILNGGKVCKAEPRGFGKTTRTANAALWAALYGYRKMVPVFGANLERAKGTIQRWKHELTRNEILFQMFPDLIWPLRALEDRYQRAPTQTFHGKPTRTAWLAEKIVLPTIKGNPGSGSVLMALPVGSSLGVTHTNSDGQILRPEFVLLDDVQKPEAAINPLMVEKLESIIENEIMLLGGHSAGMAAVMSCTVWQKGDLSTRYLNKPGWNRVLYKMLTARSTAEKKLWLGEYAGLRRGFDSDSPDACEQARRASLKFYQDNREAMDDGAEVSWPWAFNWADDDPTEISGIQHAYNILIDSGQEVFACQCQNEPLEEKHGIRLLSTDDIIAKQGHTERGVVPDTCQTVTAFVDVHPEILDYEVWAFDHNFGGCKIAGGTYPNQEVPLFTHTNPPIPLSRVHEGSDPARVTAGLSILFDQILGRQWIREDGSEIHVERCLVDANGPLSATIKAAARASVHAARIMPSFGIGITARRKPISQWIEQEATKSAGPEWTKIKRVSREPRGIMFDTNYWKTRFHSQLALPIGEVGSLVLYRLTPTTQTAHNRSAQGYRAEKPIEVRAVLSGRTVQEWALKPGLENHPFDCAVGAMVAASVCGVTSGVATGPITTKRKMKVSYTL